MDVRSINKLFPKIDNLEHFPLKVLMNIFGQLDYMDLYNLAEHSCRFENIAKIILNERYAHEYFMVDEMKQKRETYLEFFKRFGNEIKAINAKNIKMKKNSYRTLPELPWIRSLLHTAKNLEKLILEGLYVEFVFAHVNKNITHLTFRDCYEEPYKEFSKFRNLKKFEILDGAFIPFDSIAAIVHNNPSLECLVLGDNFYTRRSGICSRYPLNQLMELIATNLNQLKEFGYIIRIPRQVVTDDPPDHIIDGFFNTLKNLESLALSSNVDVFMNFTELMYRLQSECHKNIKILKLYDIDGGDIELFNIIRSFENVESLTLACTEFGDEIYVAVEHLPFLRDLDITLHTDEIDWSFVLELLRKCSTLEKLTVAGDANDGKIELLGTNQFYNQFVDTIQNRNVKLTVKFKDQFIGSISKNEVTWRNKLMRWMGYDRNSSNINLLDLAEKPSNAATNTDRPSLFDSILGYLDLNSLYSLSKANDNCAQLVESHVKQHSQQQGIFIITDEFNRLRREINMFAEYVTNLRANILYENIEDLLYSQYFLEGFHNLTTMYIYAEAEANVSPHHLIVQQVRHLIFDGPCFRYYSQLHELSVMCPDLETLELKQVVGGYFDEGEKESLEFRNLKRFTLKYHKNIQHLVESLQTIFKDTNTKLCLNI